LALCIVVCGAVDFAAVELPVLNEGNDLYKVAG
jgi:hypothetical protein